MLWSSCYWVAMCDSKTDISLSNLVYKSELWSKNEVYKFAPFSCLRWHYNARTSCLVEIQTYFGSKFHHVKSFPRLSHFQVTQSTSTLLNSIRYSWVVTVKHYSHIHFIMWTHTEKIRMHLQSTIFFLHGILAYKISSIAVNPTGHSLDKTTSSKT